ncbi:RNA chaperone Hfq [Curvibacter sp. APW13]|uniref:RNA chaperone Hfq n=1 Tax=Curvibacter sp. APW13 TaxID=3077236 RepID=UPI0028DEF7D3|nr:RNA chaperone Hfq [Curvibacter sp. APW13]MDT8992692.1 RNA chaperone Hfq [Curvibacter sp. APW13]
MKSTPKEAGTKTAPDLQTLFLEQLMKTRTPVSCFLVNGVRLGGTIESMDRYTILITNTRGGSAPQLVYKAAISTICPESRAPARS